MSLDSPAEIISYTRFLDVRQQRRERAMASCTPEPVAPVAHDVNVLPEKGTSVETAVVKASASVVSDLSW